jgi:nitroreductase
MSLEQRIEQGPANHKVISKAVNRSQHTQRNFDLSKTIPDSDLKELLHSMTECPSKNNIAFYGVHMITNRHMIEALYDTTKGFHFKDKDGNWDMQGNSQILANLVVIFEALPINLEMFENEPEGYVPPNGFRNAEHYLMKNPQHSNETITSSEIVPHKTSDEAMAALKTDQATAIGIAAGYLNLTAAMLGYRTGCCSCFNSDAVKQVANLEHGAFLLMGVGFHNNEKNRREHQTDDFTFHTMRKQPVPVKWRV